MDDAAARLISYLQEQVLDVPVEGLGPTTPLISSGLVDSFALVDVLLEVEKVTNTKIAASKVQPKDMDTIQLMLETAARLGKPR